MMSVTKAIASLVPSIRDEAPVFLRDVAMYAGLASVSYGAWLIYQPAGFIVGGALLSTASVLATMTARR